MRSCRILTNQNQSFFFLSVNAVSPAIVITAPSMGRALSPVLGESVLPAVVVAAVVVEFALVVVSGAVVSVGA